MFAFNASEKSVFIIPLIIQTFVKICFLAQMKVKYILIQISEGQLHNNPPGLDLHHNPN